MLQVRSNPRNKSTLPYIGIQVAESNCTESELLEQIITQVYWFIYISGIIVMSYPWGYLSDTKGRKLVLMLAMGGSFITSTLSSMSPNWQTMALLRFLGSAL